MDLTHKDLVATFLECACWDHHVHGKGDHRMYDCAAQRHLAQHPEIAGDSLYTAVVCGDLAEVQRILVERPEAANEPGGARGWPPLLYLCYTRFSHLQTINNSIAIGRLLLNSGADPNASYMAGDAVYSALVGVAGEGEQDSPRQPQGKALFQLLLERGANPFDIQVLYNTHFSGDVLWWLELIYAHSKKSGRMAEWADPNWTMLDMGGYGSGAQFLLGLAVKKNNLVLAEWCLSRGARPFPQPPPYLPKHAKAKSTDLDVLHREAVGVGFTEMGDLLARYGAAPRILELEGEEAFAAACFRLDRNEAVAQLEQHQEYLQSPTVIFAAARRDRADVVELLLDLGVPIDIEDTNRTRTLHQAAVNNSMRVAKLLIERGAEIDPIETCYNSSPIGWAAHSDHKEMIEFLSQFSRDIWRLAFRGYPDRLREVLRTEPELAKSVTEDGITPLWWLPDDEKNPLDETKALTIVEILLAHGADPTLKNKSGRTAADWARKRGMRQVAQLLDDR